MDGNRLVGFWAFAVRLLFVPVVAGPVSGTTIVGGGAGRRNVGASCHWARGVRYEDDAQERVEPLQSALADRERLFRRNLTR